MNEAFHDGISKLSACDARLFALMFLVVALIVVCNMIVDVVSKIYE